MKKKILLGLFILFANLVSAKNKLEYNVDYSQDNFIVVTISEASDSSSLKDYHIVQREESLEEIAEKYKVSVEDLEKINKISRFDNLKKGGIIYLKPKQRRGNSENKK